MPPMLWGCASSNSVDVSRCIGQQRMHQDHGSSATIRSLLEEAASLCRQEQRQLLVYFLSMALEELRFEADRGDRSTETTTQH